MSAESLPHVAVQHCPACDGTRISTGVLPRGRYRMESCHDCGLRWRSDAPSQEELAGLYASGFYVPAVARGGLLVRQLHRLSNQIRLREIADLPPGRLLDVGSGKGRFLDAARHAGWDVTGVEFAGSSADATESAYGINVVRGDFADVPLGHDFDVVTLWHVLEHLPDPVGALARAADLLKPGGRLVVSVPNNESLQARLGRDEWFHLDSSRHLFHFGTSSLSAMIARTGFVVDRIGHFYPELEVIGVVQTIANKVVPEQDLLYRYAKRDPSAPWSRDVAISAGVALAMLPLAVVWSGVAPIMRSGASIQLVAHPASTKEIRPPSIS